MPSTTSESPQSMTTERTHEGCQRQGKSADSPVTKVTEMTVEVPEADDAETAITATEVAAAAAAAAAAVAVEQVAAAPQTEHKNGKGQTQSAETFEIFCQANTTAVTTPGRDLIRRGRTGVNAETKRDI